MREYTTVLLIRHAESTKNIKDIHGGEGEKLTAKGRQQSFDLCELLTQYGIRRKNATIFTAPSVQTLETANIISNRLDIIIKQIKDFVPMNLGVANGCSNKELEERFPQVYSVLTKWRNQEIDISELLIPGMDSPQDFYKRGLKILDSIEKGKINIFIATSSLFILLLNILLGHNCNYGGGYIHYNIPNCGMIWFDLITEHEFVIDWDKTNVRI